MADKLRRTQSRSRMPQSAAALSARQPHAILDQPSRINKAMKIERVLADECHLAGVGLLEIGTGSGFMAQYFAGQVGPKGHLTHVVDQRQVTDGFNFHVVPDTTLPFDDASYDVVITNHVIEHVGHHSAKLHHLSEIKRVLKPDGIVYLAVPNRWRLIEPHYRLAFLSWLARPLRTPYLRIMRKGTHYDCEPLSRFALTSLLQKPASATSKRLSSQCASCMMSSVRPHSRRSCRARHSRFSACCILSCRP